MSRSTIWQIMWYTSAALALALAASYAILGAAGFAKMYLIAGAAILQFASWSARRHRRAAAA